MSASVKQIGATRHSEPEFSVHWQKKAQDHRSDLVLEQERDTFTATPVEMDSGRGVDPGGAFIVQYFPLRGDEASHFVCEFQLALDAPIQLRCSFFCKGPVL